MNATNVDAAWDALIKEKLKDPEFAEAMVAYIASIANMRGSYLLSAETMLVADQRRQACHKRLLQLGGCQAEHHDRCKRCGPDIGCCLQYAISWYVDSFA